MSNRPSFNGSGLGGSIQSPAVLVDKLIGTAYDVVKLVSEHIAEIRHISVNFPHLITANDNIADIRAVSMQIDKVVLVANNMQAVGAVAANITQINGLYAELDKLMVLAQNIDGLKQIADNMDGLLELIANIDTIEQIIPLVPFLEQVLSEKDEIIGAKDAAEAAADAANTNAQKTGQDVIKTEASEGRANTSANAAANSAVAAEQSRKDAQTIKDSVLADIVADAKTVDEDAPAKAVWNPQTRKISFEIPRGKKGDKGNKGDKGDIGEGWSPLFALRVDGERRVFQIVDWTGGSGLKPPVTNLFVGPNGIVNTVAAGANVRGPNGPGTGDMLTSIYDPTGVNDDAFDMDKMKNGAIYVRYGVAEQLKLAGIEAGANKTPVLATVATSGEFNDLLNIPPFTQGTVSSIGLEMPAAFTVTGGPITESGIISVSYAANYQAYTTAEATKLAGVAAGATANQTDTFLRGRANHTGTQAISTVAGLQAALDATEKTANKGQANGYAGLDANGKVPLTQMNETILGAMNYQTVWNAATNTPAIPAASAANKGHFYIVNVKGSTTIDGENDWNVGDWIVSAGDKWHKIDSTDQVNSVNGKQGTVVLDKADVGLDKVANKSEAEMVASGAIKTALDDKASKAQGAKADTAVQPADIKNGATITYYQGTAAPNPSVGRDGDIYLRFA